LQANRIFCTAFRASHRSSTFCCFTISRTSSPTFRGASIVAFQSTGSASSVALIWAGDNSVASVVFVSRRRERARDLQEIHAFRHWEVVIRPYPFKQRIEQSRISFPSGTEYRGTHKGPLVLPAGTLQPTGKAKHRPCCDVFYMSDGYPPQKIDERQMVGACCTCVSRSAHRSTGPFSRIAPGHAASPHGPPRCGW
jgi:hypothetical protein